LYSKVIVVSCYKKKINVCLHYKDQTKEIGKIVGLDEYFNIVLETPNASNSSRPIRTLIKGSNVVLIEPIDSMAAAL